MKIISLGIFYPGPRPVGFVLGVTRADGEICMRATKRVNAICRVSQRFNKAVANKKQI
jgi:hypothetical protein